MGSPLIAISAARQTVDTAFGPMPSTVQNVAYANGVLAAGGRPAILPSTADIPEDLLEGFDGLLLTGGGDIDPRLYGEDPIETVYDVCEIRDDFEIELYNQALLRGMPILATCRGMQLINVIRGGNLIQEVSPNRGHWQDGPSHEPWHSVQLEPGSELARIANQASIPVNSYHHQGLGRIGKGLRVVGREGDVVEAIEADDANLIGVQWHPEHMFEIHAAQKALFVDLVEKANAHAQSQQPRQEQFL
ncbi:gamma-glutamyl-gamma-aminobutyrate hydrolase family protein [Arthrobacter sp. H-02-3]|jgi:putative glutamine amidotransferase|uniref:gamma-glutamyl-gamma-aminobutyrate hydrolase family protein n=1 Tax=Arthrobacter sp. H-02-3 TaxID=2703675 RepID=UPI000DD23DEC|nr:gamma-glutamyl-gamma-aminobutyrate hydrolase family protein [Arthrobacter sp. H-02-3]PVZ53877.1 gamma-glutamyl-gamma-aminobutyrate hydrolase [Arthrobacter sp. H-02-3]